MLQTFEHQHPTALTTTLSSAALLSNDAEAQVEADAPHAIRLLEIVSELVSNTSRQA
jgi:hypothetical protein